MSNNMPKLLKDFNVLINGFSTNSTVKSIELPKITYKTQEIQTGVFTLSDNIGLENLQAVITLSEQNYNILTSLGALNNTTGQLLTFLGFQENNGGESDKIRMDMVGRFSEINHGTPTKGETTDFVLKANLQTYNYSINDTSLLQVDILTNTFIVSGINQIEKRNKALGIV